jgi:5-methylthioadenosine/S-adenosylhomocysteine deaminase
MADRRLIKDGIVLTLDRGIAAVGPDLEAPEGAEVIDASRRVVMPGFVDTHRHTWQAQLRTIACDWILGQYMTGLHSGLSGHFRPEDTYIGNLPGTVEALDPGITTLLDWSRNLATPEHADAAVEGLKESGASAVFAHGGGAPQWDVLPNAVPHPEDARRVRAEHFPTEDGLVTMAMALRGPEIATKEVTVTDYELARDLGLRITVHVGNGEMAKDPRLAWMPDIELQMGHGWPATGRLLKAGIRPTISIDVCSSEGGHMFGAMRSLIGTQRGFDHAEAQDRGEPLDHVPLTCREVVEFATIDGARACGLDDRIGTLTPGKQGRHHSAEHRLLRDVPRQQPLRRRRLQRPPGRRRHDPRRRQREAGRRAARARPRAGAPARLREPRPHLRPGARDARHRRHDHRRHVDAAPLLGAVDVRA